MLPTLPPSLQELGCCHNQITSLPTLPLSLVILDCDYNLMPISIYNEVLTEEDKDKINKVFQCLERFKLLFYCLKYKAKLRDWLWLKVRLPKIEKRYQPSKFNELLNNSEHLTEEELDDALSNW